MQSGKRLTLKDYFAKHTRTHKNHKNTNVELLLSTVKFSFGVSQSECKIDRPRPGLPPFSYPEPFLRAARRGALAKSITGYHENMVIEYIRY